MLLKVLAPVKVWVDARSAVTVVSISMVPDDVIVPPVSPFPAVIEVIVPGLISLVKAMVQSAS